ncbi:ribosomal protein L7/L12 [Aerococcus viridans]
MVKINQSVSKTILLEFISKGEKIKAVKEYRLATGAGLLEAKQYVDHLRK